MKATFEDDEETAYELLGETWGYLAIYDEDEPTDEHIDFDSRSGYTETGRNFVF